MSTRTREHGTHETISTDGAERIAAFRAIVERKQYAIIDGCTVDGFTASAVVQVYDALSEPNREKMRAMSVPVMVDVTWKLIKRTQGAT